MVRHTNSGSVTESSYHTGTKTVSRRSFLAATGAVGTASIAGCIGGDNGDAVTIGGFMALSGPFGPGGQLARQSTELAVDMALEAGDVGGRDVELMVEDTQADPSIGRTNAQEYVDDGVDLFFGSVSSAVAAPVSDVAQQNGILYISMGGDPAFTGEECKPMHFAAGNNPINQGNAAARYAYDQFDGDTLFTITSDFAWGQTHLETQVEQTAPDFGIDHVGNTFTDLGQGDYSGAITEAQNNDPDFVYFSQYGDDHIDTLNQAYEFGLLDDAVCIWPLTGISEAEAIEPTALSHENFVSGLWWYGGDELSSDGEDYLNAHLDQYDERPNSTGAVMYAAMRTLLATIGDIDSKDSDELRDELRGREYDEQIWGVGEHFRACDQSGIYPMVTVTGREEPEGQDFFEVLAIPEDPESEQYRSCEETGCTF